jgi:hypothetical protein
MAVVFSVVVTPMLTIIAVMVAVPVMVVFPPAVIAIPVPFKESLSVVAGTNPTCAGIGRTSPVTLMPLVVVPHRIPVSFHPDEFRAWSWWKHPNNSRRRWRSDHDSNRHLAERKRPGNQ